MPVRLKLKELAEARSLNISQLQRQSGLYMGMVRRYWYNEGRRGQPLTEVNLEALGVLARILSVEPGDLLERVPEREG